MGKNIMKGKKIKKGEKEKRRKGEETGRKSSPSLNGNWEENIPIEGGGGNM